MEKWEYLTRAVGVADLAALGNIGWRLVSVHDNIMFFERPVEEGAPAMETDAAAVPAAVKSTPTTKSAASTAPAAE